MSVLWVISTISRPCWSRMRRSARSACPRRARRSRGAAPRSGSTESAAAFAARTACVNTGCSSGRSRTGIRAAAGPWRARRSGAPTRTSPQKSSAQRKPPLSRYARRLRGFFVDKAGRAARRTSWTNGQWKSCGIGGADDEVIRLAVRRPADPCLGQLREPDREVDVGVGIVRRPPTPPSSRRTLVYIRRQKLKPPSKLSAAVANLGGSVRQPRWKRCCVAAPVPSSATSVVAIR